ncbi:MAG: DMT family transporter [Acetivibrio sp.]
MIYYIFSLITAVLVAAMIVANGGLSDVYGAYLSTVMIHGIGLLSISLICLVKKKKVFRDKLPFLLHIGGAIGYVSTISNNMAFGKISVSAIIALGLLAQSVTALIIDQYGLLGMPKQTFHKSKILGILFTFLGIFYLLSGSKVAIIPILLSCLAGISIIVARTFNARLADKTNMYSSTWYNFSSGFLVSLLFLFTLGKKDMMDLSGGLSPKLWIYLGGFIGMIIVILSNMCVTKISAFYMTLIMFVGQIFTGILFDILLTQTFSVKNLICGAIVAFGLSLDVLMQQYKKKK